MSWAGEQARKDLVSNLGYDIVEETTRAVAKLRNHGVEHGDVRPPNVLWNPEGRKVMLVDFERSEILKQVPILQEISPNRKRKHLYSTDRASCSAVLTSVSMTSLAIKPKTSADRHSSSSTRMTTKKAALG
jgi:serine/threonine protein kinase